MERMELLEAVSKETGTSIPETEKILDSMLNTMTKSFIGGESVELGPNFGKFDVRMREPGRFKNGGAIKQAASERTVVVFKATKNFKKAINKKGENIDCAI